MSIKWCKKSELNTIVWKIALIYVSYTREADSIIIFQLKKTIKSSNSKKKTSKKTLSIFFERNFPNHSDCASECNIFIAEISEQSRYENYKSLPRQVETVQSSKWVVEEHFHKKEVRRASSFAFYLVYFHSLKNIFCWRGE